VPPKHKPAIDNRQIPGSHEHENDGERPTHAV
jgi:hypothetical protein